jgi:hypothetical protein
VASQERKLEKYEDRENELPQLISSHNNEVRSLREQLRRMREKYDKTDRYLRDAEDELELTKSKLKKYKALSDEKNLAERAELDRKVRQNELAIEEKDSRIKVRDFFFKRIGGEGGMTSLSSSLCVCVCVCVCVCLCMLVCALACVSVYVFIRIHKKFFFSKQSDIIFAF